MINFLEDIWEGYWEWLHHQRLRMELLLIIPIVELAVRIWYHLDTRVYSSKRRILGVHNGDIANKSQRYALLVLHSNFPLPVFTQNVIDAIRRSPLNLVIVSNVALRDEDRRMLLERSHLLIERVNLGRDFGGYRDGIEVAFEKFPDIERLVLLNDSLFYSEKGLDKLIADLDGPHDFIGVTEVFEHHYHVQSYMLSFGKRILQNKRFRDYWRKYRPISSRRWSIHKGEVKLTQVVVKAGFRPYVLYQGAQLTEHFRRASDFEILSSLDLLPTRLRARLNKELLRGKSLEHVLRVNMRNEGYQKWETNRFIKTIVANIARRNQIHIGGFLFRKYLGLPIMKRDLLFREVYMIDELYDLLTDFREPLRDEIMSDLRRGGTAENLKGFRRLLYRHGSI